MGRADAPTDVRTKEAAPHAAMLIESMRDIGYSLETALADIIDNSITAQARSIRLFADTTSAQPSLAILDDGEGMTEDELLAAMRPGSRNPLDTRSPAASPPLRPQARRSARCPMSAASPLWLHRGSFSGQ